MDKLDLAKDEVRRSLIRLESEYLTIKRLDPRPPMVTAISGEARRAAGQWPDPEAITADIVRRLEEAADAAPEEKKRTIKEFLHAAAAEGADLLGTAVGGAIRSGIGM